MTGITYYNYDNCYKATEITNDNCLNTFLTNNFNIENVSSVSECGNKSLLQSAQYFLMSDLCNNTQKSNCYIPKKELASTFDDILQPLRNMFGDNLDSNFNYSKIPAFNGLAKLSLESSSNLYIDDTNKCLNYTVDDKVYAPKKKICIIQII